MHIYDNDIDEINNAIDIFNQYLSEHKVPRLVADFTDARPKPMVINDNKRGVYFIFGHRANKCEENILGVYIGKASLNSCIGTRVRHHCRNYYRPQHNSIICNDRRAVPYVLKHIASIELESAGLVFMTPALEEFLISHLKEKIKLINGTGNI